MITAEYFDRDRLQEQAADVAALVAEEAIWLREARPATTANYRDALAAEYSMERVIGARTLNGLILRREEAAIGLGTVISRMTIYHPEQSRQRLTASQIDYWAADGVTEAEHEVITDLLIKEAGAKGVMAFLSDAEAEHALGIPHRMDKVGVPGRIRTPFGVRDFGLSKSTTPLQVYLQRNEA